MLIHDRHIRRLPNGGFRTEADEAEYRAQLEQQAAWDRASLEPDDSDEDDEDDEDDWEDDSDLDDSDVEIEE